MSYATQLQEVERDLARLYRRAAQVEADLRDVAVLPAAKLHSALFALTSKHPGLVSLGVLLGLPESDQQGLVRGLWPAGAQRDFVQRLLDTVQTDTGLMNGFRRLLPQTVPPEPRRPSIARSSSETPKEQQSASDQAKQDPDPAKPERDPAKPERDPAEPERDPAKPERDPAEPQPELIDETLRRLIFQCLESPELPAVHFAAPVSGHLAEYPIQADDSLTLAERDDGELAIQGPGHHNFARFGGNRGPGIVPPIVADADLSLADGSRVYAETFLATGSHLQMGRQGSTSTWRGLLSQWHWWKSEEVRYWVAQIPAVDLRSPGNLIVGTQDQWTRGLYVPGTAPLALVGPRNAAKNERLLFFAALSQPLESLRLTWSLLDVATVLLGCPAPYRMYGFDARGELTAIAGRSRVFVRSARKVNAEFFDWFPPVDPGSPSGAISWVAVFVQRLLGACMRRPSVVQQSFLEYRSILETVYVGDQLAKLGTVIRILLHSEGSLRGDAYLSIEQVSAALQSVAQRRAIVLPDGAVASLEAAHRSALLGENGLAPRAMDRHSQWRAGQPIEMLKTLRLTYASLLAAFIGYTGPIDTDDLPNPLNPSLHYPLRQPRPDAVAEDKRLAALRYVAEPPSKT